MTAHAKIPVHFEQESDGKWSFWTDSRSSISIIGGEYATREEAHQKAVEAIAGYLEALRPKDPEDDELAATIIEYLPVVVG